MINFKYWDKKRVLLHKMAVEHKHLPYLHFSTSFYHILDNPERERHFSAIKTYQMLNRKISEVLYQ